MHENTWKCGELKLYFSPSIRRRIYIYIKKKLSITRPPSNPVNHCRGKSLGLVHTVPQPFYWVRGKLYHRQFGRSDYSHRALLQFSQMCHETVKSAKGKHPAVSQGCQIDRYTLEPSSLPSVQANYRKIAFRQGVKLPSPETFVSTHLLPQ